MFFTATIIRQPIFWPVHRNFACGNFVGRGIDGFGFCACRQVHFLEQGRYVFGFAIVFAAIKQAREFAGYGICRKQNAWLECFQAESIFGGVDVVFYERRIAVIEREMLGILGICLRENPPSCCDTGFNYYYLSSLRRSSMTLPATRQ